MAEKNKLIVKIDGREYTITSQESRAYMLGVADLVDRKMKEITHLSPELNTSLAAVLTALNLADDCVRLQRVEKELKQQNARYAERVKSLEAEVQALKRNRY